MTIDESFALLLSQDTAWVIHIYIEILKDFFQFNLIMAYGFRTFATRNAVSCYSLVIVNSNVIIIEIFEAKI